VWLPRAARVLSVLHLLNVGPLDTAQAQQSAPSLAQIDAFIAAGKKLRFSGDYTRAIRKLSIAAKSARAIADPIRESVALREESVCYLSSFRYREGLRLAQTARALAAQQKDDADAGAAAIVLCSTYRLLGDYASAEEESAYAINSLANTSNVDFLAKALLNQAIIEENAGKNVEALTSVRRAIVVAHQAGVQRLEGYAWDICGLLLLKQDKLPGAEQGLNNAVAIQVRINDTDNLAVTREHFAELELKKRNYAAALKFVDQAFGARSPAFKINAQYYPVHVRAQILLGLGRTNDALREFRHAVDLASEWRTRALPGDVSSTSTVAQLHEAYQDYAELAASLALKNHNPALARAGLEALAENRAANLREELTRSLDENQRLPAEYFALLSSLQKEQANVTLGEKPREHEARLRQTQLQLSELENRIGLNLPDASSPEAKDRHKYSLKSIQTKLSATELLLSFCLGKQKSFVWAVTHNGVSLYKLPDETTIGNQAKAFTAAALANKDIVVPGRALAKSLFGQLTSAVQGKHDWLIVGDGALLDGVPFSALPTSSDGVPLSRTHSIRLLPSELLLLQPQIARPAAVFVGIADPIYSPRDRRGGGTPSLKVKRGGEGAVLARLAGSGREVKAAATSSGLSVTDLLTGSHATEDLLRRAIAKRPEVVHFAVHVVSPEGRPQEAALALSLTNNGMPELLTPEAVASFRVPGSLVVMSGCDSEQGKTVPSAGLIGLSRAWLLAGAAAVIVTAWPISDDSGQFFSSFYAHLQKHSGPLPKRASLALQEAQSDMQRGGGYGSSPSFWAAYSIISKE